MRWGLFKCLLIPCVMAFGILACGQVRAVVPVRSLPPDLSTVTRSAGIIFAGRVLAISPVRLPSSAEVSSVEVTCQVEQAVRGTRVGERLAFREWAGLWTSGERYRIGQRLMLFLYAPGPLGLTSPVGGAAGRFAVDRSGRIVLTEGQRQAIRISPSPIHLDVQPTPDEGEIDCASENKSARSSENAADAMGSNGRAIEACGSAEPSPGVGKGKTSAVPQRAGRDGFSH